MFAYMTVTGKFRARFHFTNHLDYQTFIFESSSAAYLEHRLIFGMTTGTYFYKLHMDKGVVHVHVCFKCFVSGTCVLIWEGQSN